MEIKEILT